MYIISLWFNQSSYLSVITLVKIIHLSISQSQVDQMMEITKELKDKESSMADIKKLQQAIDSSIAKIKVRVSVLYFFRLIEEHGGVIETF